MKTIKSILLSAVVLTFVAAHDLAAQTIKTPAFAQPLVEQWIKVYNESHPNQAISMSGKGSAEADIQIVVSRQQAAQLGQTLVAFGRYAILPFASAGSDAATTFGTKHYSKTKLEHIFFNLNEEEDEFGDFADANKGMTIYAGNSSATVANSFAEYFGQPVTAFRGKRIQGDDRFVNTAVSRDQRGIAFNAVSNLYDLQTRQLRQGIQLLGLDVKRDLQHALESQNLDELLTALETTQSDPIATAVISLSYNGTDVKVNEFVNWVLTDGVKYNHQFGLLNNDLLLQAGK